MVLVAVLIGATAACVNSIEGSIGITRTDDGGLAIAVAWCDRPARMGAAILQPDPWKTIVVYANPKVGSGAEYEIIDMNSPAHPWQIEKGSAHLEPGIRYHVEAWPDDGKEGIFGQVEFTPEDVENLKPRQVLKGIPGSVVSWDEFREDAKSVTCAFT
ncbi:hypothetical protein [Herbidospora sp. RD11066]